MENVEEAASLAASAFIANPSYGYIFDKDVYDDSDLLNALRSAYGSSRGI